jgi:hypothetical protein
MLWRIFSAETERPSAAIVIERTETATCEGIPHLFCRFSLDGMKSRIFVAKENLSLYFKVFKAVLTMQAFLINSRCSAIQLSASLAECIIKFNE